MNAQRIGKLKLRLQKARAELLKSHPDFAQPLRELLFVATKDVYHIQEGDSISGMTDSEPSSFRKEG